jgi:hypothetical protein
MRFATVQTLFWKRHPCGSMIKLRNNRVRVQFSPDSKAYEYLVRSNSELAERLELIPHDDIAVIAKRVLEQLLDAKTATIDQSGAGDTVRWYWSNEYGRTETVVETPFSTDEYDRPVSMYAIDTDPDPWRSWVTQGEEARDDS